MIDPFDPAFVAPVILFLSWRIGRAIDRATQPPVPIETRRPTSQVIPLKDLREVEYNPVYPPGFVPDPPKRPVAVIQPGEIVMRSGMDCTAAELRERIMSVYAVPSHFIMEEPFIQASKYARSTTTLHVVEEHKKAVLQDAVKTLRTVNQVRSLTDAELSLLTSIQMGDF